MERFMTIVVLAGLIATAAGAATMLSPISATVTPPGSSTGAAEHLIDQSGLSAPYTSGVTDFDAYLAGNPTHESIRGTAGSSSAVQADFDFDFGRSILIDRIGIFSFGANTSFAVNDLTVLASDDAGFAAPIHLGSLSLAIDPNPTLAQVLNLVGGGTAARFYRLSVQSNHGGVSSSLGEVIFSAPIPEPATAALVMLGLLGLAQRRTHSRSRPTH